MCFPPKDNLNFLINQYKYNQYKYWELENSNQNRELKAKSQ